MRDDSNVPGARDDDVEVQREASGVAPGRDLLAALMDELSVLYGPSNEARTPSATPAELSPPGGTFLVLLAGGAAVACGGVKALGDGTGEVKRMYVVPAHRGRGHARRLLGALEDAARALGHARLRLDTGAEQPQALALYESAGYRHIPDYNGNPYASHWLEKAL